MNILSKSNSNLEKSSLSLSKIALLSMSLLILETTQFHLSSFYQIGHQEVAIGKKRMTAENQKLRLDTPSWLKFIIMIELSLDTRIFSWSMNLRLHSNKTLKTLKKLTLTHVVIKELLIYLFISQRTSSTVMKLLSQM
jgi:hypothetical protein